MSNTRDARAAPRFARARSARSALPDALWSTAKWVKGRISWGNPSGAVLLGIVLWGNERAADLVRLCQTIVSIFRSARARASASPDNADRKYLFLNLITRICMVNPISRSPPIKVHRIVRRPDLTNRLNTVFTKVFLLQSLSAYIPPDYIPFRVISRSSPIFVSSQKRDIIRKWL